MKLFQNKFFIICLSVALVVAIVPSTFALMGYDTLSRNIVGTLTFPFRWGFSLVADGFEGWARYFNSINALMEERDRLQSENDELRLQINRAELLEQENERLRAFLGMKNQYPSFTMEEGTVISYSAGNYMTTFTLNRGSVHGVEKGMPVVNERGVVGTVTSVGLNWCMVSTIIETGVKVGVMIPRSGEVGILEGDYGLRYDGVCKIMLDDTAADIRIGDEVVTSGTGSNYPADLVIGNVTDIKINASDRRLVVTVKPMVNLEDLKWVMIITGYEK